MPSGIYERNKETKRKLSEAKKGIKFSEEHKGKISKSLEGIKYSNRKKPSSFSEEHRENMSKARKGHIVLRETRKKIGKAHTGKKRTEETKKNISQALKDRLVWNKGKKGIYSEETRRKMSEVKIKNPNRVFKNTSIELKTEKELKRRNIDYQKQVPLCKRAIVDFYLPKYRIIIQCDGDYWHNLPKQKEKDEQQDKILTLNGFNVYRFWEHEINQSVSNCINKLKVVK